MLTVGITLGDPAGIGPEVAVKALVQSSFSGVFPLLIGRYSLLKDQYGDCFADKKCIAVHQKDEISALAKGNADLENYIYVYDVGSEFPLPEPGSGSALTGAESLLYIDTSIDLWKSGHIDAVTTGPVHKAFVNKNDSSFAGHTEYYAAKTGDKIPYMLMYSEKYSVILVTTHCPIASLPKYVTEKSIFNTIECAHDSLQKILGRKPKIAVAGFDPHCGDKGAINDFDELVTRQSIAKAQKKAIQVEGPFSADTLFIPDRWAGYDVAVAMYHDQGLTPFKMLAFDTGVNVTLGLSIVRTSVDHGTAFDIAGKGLASYTSMVEAIDLAAHLV